MLKNALRITALAAGLALSALALLACDPGARSQSAGSVAGVNADPDQAGISGGNEVQKGDNVRLYLVSVYFEGKEGPQHCTGSLIARRAVLTAAHCAPPEAANLRVHFVTDDRNPGAIPAERMRKVVDTSIHPKFKETQALVEGTSSANPYDLAVLKLERDAPEGTRHFQLGERLPTIQEVSGFYIAGFGATSYMRSTGQSMGSGLLRVGTAVRRSSDIENIIELDHTKKFDSEQPKATGACVGDSGGPAFTKNNLGFVIYGVLSSVNNNEGDNACSGWSSYANTVTQIGWIAQKALKFSAQF